MNTHDEQIPTCTQKFVQLVNNAKENEPWFLAIATAIAIGGNPPAWGASALYIYCASRFAHAVLFVAEFPKSVIGFQVLIRAVPYLVGVFTMFGLSATQIA